MTKSPGRSPVSLPRGVVFRLATEVLSVPVTVRTSSPAAAQAVGFQYAPMCRGSKAERSGDYSIGPDPCAESSGIAIDILTSQRGGDSFEVCFDGVSAFQAEGCGHLLHELDNQLTFRLQLQLPELYFVHAACLAKKNAATLFMGESGSGKSTTAFGLCVLGLSYLSDELAPIDPITRTIIPYPRALCLKNPPPQPLLLPPEYLHTEWTLHVHADQLGTSTCRAPVPLKRIVFLRMSPVPAPASLRSLSRGEAAVRLYQNALNQLAHPMWGLDETLRIVAELECFELVRGGVEETLRLVEKTGAL